MRLRIRTIGASETFHPFKRLPTELRCMIWRFSIQPRVVEVLEKETLEEDINTHTNGVPNDSSVDDVDRLSLRYKRQVYWEAVRSGERLEDETSEAENNLLARYFSFANTMLPPALYVCHESRDTLLPLYPYCFASETHPAGVRFNLAVDTLYVDIGLEENLVNFMASFGPMELSKLRNFAIADDLGYGNENEFWQRVGSFVDKLTDLKNVPLVRDVANCLDAIFQEMWPQSNPYILLSPVQVVEKFPLNRKVQLVYKMMEDCEVISYNCIEFREEFPHELLRQLDFTEEELPLPSPYGDQAWRDQEWITENATAVWGWRHVPYPDAPL